MSQDEKYLLSRAKKGDIEAFEQLIEEYQKKIFNIALKLIGNYDDASELTQEVLIRIYRSIGKFKEQSSFATWIYSITKNVCYDELRKRKNKNIVSLDQDILCGEDEVQRQLPDTGPSPGETVERNETVKIVNEAIQALSTEHKMVIVMRDIEGLSYEDIAKVLDCPEGTVKSRINRARKALKEILKNKRELFSEDYVK